MLVIPFFPFLPSSAYAVGWYNPSWLYREAVTIDYTKVGADLTDFPVYINLANLGASFFSHVNNGGGDIRITKSDGTTELAREVVSCNTGTSTGELHFKADTLSSSANTVFYIYYGNAGASDYAVTDTYGRNAVWSNGYVGVWHLSETSGSAADSVGTHTGTFNGNLPSAATGIMGSGQNLNGTTGYIQTDSGELQTADSFTISAWFQTTVTDYAHHIAWEGDVAGNGWGTQAEINLSIGEYTTSGQANRLSTWLGSSVTGSAADAISLGVAFTDTTNFNYMVAVMTNLSTSPAGEMFLNGVSQGTDTGTTANTSRAGWNTNLRVGRAGTNERYFSGVIDEVRLSGGVRTSGWNSTEYNNQYTPGTFYSVGAETPNSPPTVDAVGIYETDHVTPVTSLTPQTEYAVKVTVTDADTLNDLDTVKVTIFYDTDSDNDPADVPGTGDTRNAAILTCTVSGTPSWQIDPSASTTWVLESGSSVQPTLTNNTGDFWFHFRPGKVATESADWDAYAAADDGVNTPGTLYDSSGYDMNWYGEVSIDTVSVTWGPAAPGTDFGDTTKQTGISVTYISNGSYYEKVSAGSTWTSASGDATLNAGGNPGALEISIKAAVTDNLTSAVLAPVYATYATIDDTGTPTGESGDVVATNTLWLKLGTPLYADTFSGTIYYMITDSP
ncbi:MAG: hypothetical protein A2Z05_05795 [Chloroflexi bacterium RBG_16_60_22]|nr:MAG: hypothetical protein A2Z05_05795 [Chloroflexi bacterium RBG_16_60_22]